MKQMRQWAQRGAPLLGVALMVALSTSAHAESHLHSYALPEYYLGADGEPPTLEELAAETRSFFRSEAAYVSFQSGAFSGDDLATLLTQGRVETVACSGRHIETSGITAAGEVRWFTRECYAGEQLIQVLDSNGEQQIVASLACLNLVRRVIEPTPVVSKPPEPREGPGWGVFNTPPRVHHLPDLDLCNCTPIPGRTIYQSGSGLRPATNWNN